MWVQTTLLTYLDLRFLICNKMKLGHMPLNDKSVFFCCSSRSTKLFFIWEEVFCLDMPHDIKSTEGYCSTAVTLLPEKHFVQSALGPHVYMLPFVYGSCLPLLSVCTDMECQYRLVVWWSMQQSECGSLICLTAKRWQKSIYDVHRYCGHTHTCG